MIPFTSVLCTKPNCPLSSQRPGGETPRPCFLPLLRLCLPATGWVLRLIFLPWLPSWHLAHSLLTQTSLAAPPPSLLSISTRGGKSKCPQQALCGSSNLQAACRTRHTPWKTKTLSTMLHQVALGIHDINQVCLGANLGPTLYYSL